MLETYAYLCNLRKCKDCAFPDGVNYYMEYAKRPVLKGE